MIKVIQTGLHKDRPAPAWKGHPKFQPPSGFPLAAHPTLRPTCHHTSKGARWCQKVKNQLNATGCKSPTAPLGPAETLGCCSTETGHHTNPHRHFLQAQQLNSSWRERKKKLQMWAQKCQTSNEPAGSWKIRRLFRPNRLGIWQVTRA